MDERSDNSILRRKASEGRQDHLARVLSPDKAVRLALERAAVKGLGLALEVTGLRRDRVLHEDVAGRLDGGALLALLDGADGEPAAVSVDAQVLAGLVEHQTMGQVIARPVTGRVPTRVDAALIAPFLDDALARMVAVLEEDGAAPKWLQLYRFGAMAAGPRTLALALTAHEYHLFELELSLADGAKAGTLGFLFPECRVAPGEDAQEAFREAVAEAFRDGVLRAPAELRAVLARVQLPITRLQTLGIGELLTIPGDALHDTVLEAPTGEEVARVQFGQMNGMRAVRLRARDGSVPPDEGADGFVSEPGAPSDQELEDMLAADTVLDARLPPMEETGAADDLSGGDLDDLDALIQLSADDIGDPRALADLSPDPAEQTE